MFVKRYLFLLFLICGILLTPSVWAPSSNMTSHSSGTTTPSIILIDSRITSSTTAHHRGDTISIMYSINDTNSESDVVGVGVTLTRIGDGFTQVIPINSDSPLETISSGSEILNEDIHLPDDISAGTYDVFGTLWDGIPGVGTIIDQKNSGQIIIVSDRTHSTPSEPLAPTATLSDNVMQISWTKPIEDGGSSITKYIIQEFVDNQWQNISETPNTSVSIKVDPHFLNIFRVNAVNSNGEGDLSEPFSNNQIFDDNEGHFITAPRTVDENGVELVDITYVGGETKMLDPTAGPVPSDPLDPNLDCVGTESGVWQEGWNWDVSDNPNTIGMSVLWTKPTGEIKGGPDAGIIYNPINFHARDMMWDTGTGGQMFFQVSWGTGNLGSQHDLSGFTMTINHGRQYDTKPLRMDSHASGPFFIDALIENKSLASTSTYVVEISSGHHGFLSSIAADQIKNTCASPPSGGTDTVFCNFNALTAEKPFLNNFQSFQDQWIRYNNQDKNPDGTPGIFHSDLSKDAITQPSVIIYQGSINPYKHDSGAITPSDKFPPTPKANSYLNSTVNLLAPKQTSNNAANPKIQNERLCDDQTFFVPEFSYSLPILIIGIVSILILTRIWHSVHLRL